MGWTTQAEQRTYSPHRVGSGYQQSWELWPPETLGKVTLFGAMGGWLRSGYVIGSAVRHRRAVGASMMIFLPYWRSVGRKREYALQCWTVGDVGDLFLQPS
jgi:hypothetical protein